MVKDAKSSWRPGASRILQGAILDLALFKLFINNLDDGAECTLSKFTEGTKLGGVANSPKSHAVIQQDPDRLSDKSLSVQQGKLEVLHLVRNNSRHRYMLRATRLQSRFAGKDLGGLVDTNLVESAVCFATKKAALNKASSAVQEK